METTKKVKPTKPAVKKSSTQSASSKKAGPPISHGVGRRKRSVARVWLRRGKGTIIVNGKAANEYFDTDYNKARVALPMGLFKNVSYDVEANVRGGGVNTQADAVKLGISRALLSFDPAIRPELKKHRLLTVDSRVKERKKYGQRGARRKFQFVKR